MTNGALWLPQDPVTPTSSEPPAKPSPLDDGDFGSFLIGNSFGKGL